MRLITNEEFNEIINSNRPRCLAAKAIWDLDVDECLQIDIKDWTLKTTPTVLCATNNKGQKYMTRSLKNNDGLLYGWVVRRLS